MHRAPPSGGGGPSSGFLMPAVPKRRGRLAGSPNFLPPCITPVAGANQFSLQPGDACFYMGASSGRVSAELLSVTQSGPIIRVDDDSVGTHSVHTVWSRLEPPVPAGETSWHTAADGKRGLVVVRGWIPLRVARLSGGAEIDAAWSQLQVLSGVERELMGALEPLTAAEHALLPTCSLHELAESRKRQASPPKKRGRPRKQPSPKPPTPPPQKRGPGRPRKESPKPQPSIKKKKDPKAREQLRRSSRLRSA